VVVDIEGKVGVGDWDHFPFIIEDVEDTRGDKVIIIDWFMGDVIELAGISGDEDEQFGVINECFIDLTWGGVFEFHPIRSTYFSLFLHAAILASASVSCEMRKELSFALMSLASSIVISVSLWLTMYCFPSTITKIPGFSSEGRSW
jgi:hypothetical protein